MPKILEHAKNILEAEERRGTLFWILHKIMEVICFSANVRQCWPRSQASPLSGRCMPGYSALLFQDGGRQSLHQDNSKVTALPTVPTKQAEELTGDEDTSVQHRL